MFVFAAGYAGTTTNQYEKILAKYSQKILE